MAFCTVGKRECGPLGYVLTAFQDDNERADRQESMESDCQEGIDLAAACGDLAICGNRYIATHVVEFQVERGIQERDDIAAVAARVNARGVHQDA